MGALKSEMHQSVWSCGHQQHPNPNQMNQFNRKYEEQTTEEMRERTPELSGLVTLLKALDPCIGVRRIRFIGKVEEHLKCPNRLDPDEPEPLDKILAALHCYQVAPVFSQNHSITFIVDRLDHYRLADGFPELQALAAAIHKEIPFEFDPSTGKLTTVCPTPALGKLKYAVYHIVVASLESIYHIPAPMGPLARKLFLAPDDVDDNILTVSRADHVKSPTSIFAFTATDSHIGPGKCAHYFAKHPSLHTVIVVQLALPMELETERQLQRLAEHSFVSVIAKVNGTVQTVLPREALSTPGGAITLWLSDLIKQDDAEGFTDEFLRPLHSEANNRPANITIPYATILFRLRLAYGIEVTDGNFHKSTGNSPKAGGGSGRRRSFSTLAGSNTANFAFGSVPAGGGSKRPLSTVSTLSPLTSHHMVKGITTRVHRCNESPQSANSKMSAQMNLSNMHYLPETGEMTISTISGSLYQFLLSEVTLAVEENIAGTPGFEMSQVRELEMPQFICCINHNNRPYGLFLLANPGDPDMAAKSIGSVLNNITRNHPSIEMVVRLELGGLDSKMHNDKKDDIEARVYRVAEKSRVQVWVRQNGKLVNDKASTSDDMHEGGELRLRLLSENAKGNTVPTLKFSKILNVVRNHCKKGDPLTSHPDNNKSLQASVFPLDAFRFGSAASTAQLLGLRVAEWKLPDEPLVVPASPWPPSPPLDGRRLDFGQGGVGDGDTVQEGYSAEE
ncbi:hypothetical protein B0T16DRAFT_384105 [Cercophora newfieldiana]|uniref:Uncharacterized protein n=1 Tax=Cercophora newfieldiana TaxID=92897 RepID=A0AA39YM75_9PEZI|nr:hypothetical protein B0T16DRAFT_384105 [Cercophora newfieldiana]